VLSSLLADALLSGGMIRETLPGLACPQRESHHAA
jgi:hypothetical protein